MYCTKLARMFMFMGIKASNTFSSISRGRLIASLSNKLKSQSLAKYGRLIERSTEERASLLGSLFRVKDFTATLQNLKSS